MNEWKNANVNANARKAFELATNIAWRFDDEKVRSAYVLFAAMNIPESGIFKAIGDMGMQLLPSIDNMLEDKEVFASIFGEKAAEKFFEEQVDEQEEVAETPEEKEANEFAAKVIDVLADVMGWAEDEEGRMEIMVPAYSDKLELACQEAYLRCKAMKLDYIDLDVIVYSILQNKETSAYRFINNLMAAFEIDMDNFLQSLKFTTNIVDDISEENMPIVIPAALENCLEVLNNKYTKGQEIAILGRDKEKDKVFNVFSKKTKRNCVLIGPPGAGKTAIAEAITQEIVNETCPKEFIGYTVLSLDVTSMVAGTKYRGEFEVKVSVLKKFLSGTHKIILFVDEMHEMLGAGSSEGNTNDLSGSLKPILSRDDAIFLGATTDKEYDTIVSSDGAFKRRFEVIFVNEPKITEVKPMIKAKLKALEKYHGVKMPNNLVDYIIVCSACFSWDNANPDKTLDLCDRSMAMTKRLGNKKVTKAHVHKVYEEFFEKFDKVSKQDIMGIAYHEVGHYVATRLTKENKAVSVTAVSIIPTENSLGANMLEEKDSFVLLDMEYIEANIMSLLAGRVAQFKVTKALDSGARSDLKRAKEVATKAIIQLGLDEGTFKHIYLDDGMLTEKVANVVQEKVNDLITRVYKKTEEFVDSHWREIDQMAKFLIKKKIATSEELDKFLAEQ